MLGNSTQDLCPVICVVPVLSLKMLGVYFRLRAPEVRGPLQSCQHLFRIELAVYRMCNLLASQRGPVHLLTHACHPASWLTGMQHCCAQAPGVDREWHILQAARGRCQRPMFLTSALTALDVPTQAGKGHHIILLALIASSLCDPILTWRQGTPPHMSRRAQAHIRNQHDKSRPQRRRD